MRAARPEVLVCIWKIAPGGGQDRGGTEEGRGWEGPGTRKFIDTGGQDAKNGMIEVQNAKNGMIEGLTAELDALRQVEHIYCVCAFVR